MFRTAEVDGCTRRRLSFRIVFFSTLFILQRRGSVHKDQEFGNQPIPLFKSGTEMLFLRKNFGRSGSFFS